jgi:hypothetical protein
MAAASWRPSSAPGDRGTHRDGQQRSSKRREGVGATRGGEGKQEVERQQQHSSGRGGCTAPAAEEAEEQSVPEEEEERGGVRGTHLEKQKSLGTLQ